MRRQLHDPGRQSGWCRTAGVCLLREEESAAAALCLLLSRAESPPYGLRLRAVSHGARYRWTLPEARRGLRMAHRRRTIRRGVERPRADRTDFQPTLSAIKFWPEGRAESDRTGSDFDRAVSPRRHVDSFASEFGWENGIKNLKEKWKFLKFGIFFGNFSNGTSNYKKLK